MENEYPKRLLRDGNEPQVGQINNSCRISILTRIKNVLPNEYDIVNGDPVFAHVFAIHENGLGYSARSIHNMMCRQLVTKKKHELWFVFGRKSLRFSMQEFYAVTRLKYKDDFTSDLEKWKDDKGFWSKVLKRGDKITIKKLMDEYLLEACTWEKDVDIIRFVYVCVIAELVMAKDEKKVIPLSYIQLVMDLDKVKTYPWGLLAFDHLVESIIDSRKKLKNIKSYVLDGFSFALQIWVMEAIPLIGELLGEKIREELTEAPRCCNWKSAAKVSYDDIITLEDSFGPTEIQTKSYGKHLHVAQYFIVDVSVPPGLNKSHCDCGVYALKYIECHMLKLDMSLINDDNIREARMRIAVDLWEAASDPLFIDRMEKYEPPKISSDIVDIS